MAIEPNRSVSTLSGLTEPEAKEFNRIFVLSFCLFTAVAIVAHVLAWFWRPWGGSYSNVHTAALHGLHAAGHMLAAFC